MYWFCCDRPKKTKKKIKWMPVMTCCVVCVQVTSRWMVLPGTWTVKRTASSPPRSWTRVKTWPTPSPTISSTPHTIHISQVHTHTQTEAVGECKLSLSTFRFCIYIITLDSISLLTDYMCSSSILPHMNASLAHFEMQWRLHIILGWGLCLTGQSVK